LNEGLEGAETLFEELNRVAVGQLAGFLDSLMTVDILPVRGDDAPNLRNRGYLT